MTDLLTHVLVVYVAVTVATWRGEWVAPRMVPVAMVGAVLPDVSKLYLLVDARAVEGVLGVPFSWLSIHRAGPVVALAGVVAVCVDRRHRRAAFGWLLFGAGTHFLLDLGVRRASGSAPPYLYPLSWVHPPAANLYLSSDIWMAILAVGVGVAVPVWYLDRR